MPDTANNAEVISALTQALRSQTQSLSVVARVVENLSDVVRSLTPGDIFLTDADLDGHCGQSGCGCSGVSASSAVSGPDPIAAPSPAPAEQSAAAAEPVAAERKPRGRPAGSSKKSKEAPAPAPAAEAEAEVAPAPAPVVQAVDPETDPFPEEAAPVAEAPAEEIDLLAEFDDPTPEPEPEPKVYTQGEVMKLVGPLVRDPATKDKVVEAVKKWGNPSEGKFLTTVPEKNYAAFLADLGVS